MDALAEQTRTCQLSAMLFYRKSLGKRASLVPRTIRATRPLWTSKNVENFEEFHIYLVLGNRFRTRTHECTFAIGKLRSMALATNKGAAQYKRERLLLDRDLRIICKLIPSLLVCSTFPEKDQQLTFNWNTAWRTDNSMWNPLDETWCPVPPAWRLTIKRLKCRHQARGLRRNWYEVEQFFIGVQPGQALRLTIHPLGALGGHEVHHIINRKW